MMGWLRRTNAEYRTDIQLGIGDPALAEYLGMSAGSSSGIAVSEASSLGLSAVWRSVSLIAGTIGTLPLKTYKRNGDIKERKASFLDKPHPDMTQFEWTETVMAQILLWGNDYLLNIYGGAGQIVGLGPIPPAVVAIEVDATLGKVFKVRQPNGTIRAYTAADITHVPGLGYDGIRGLSPVGVARNSLGASMARERTAANMYRNGLHLGGVITSKEALTKTQATKITDGLKAKAGVDHAGDFAFIPSPVQFNPWTMNAVDAQFLESMHFGIEEIARWFGVPRELLSESGASSWGSGIQEIVRGFARFCLAGWTTRLEQRLSTLLPAGQFCEFDYTGLLQPAPDQEIDLLIRQVDSGILTKDEARAIRNLPPIAPAEAPELEVANVE